MSRRIRDEDEYVNGSKWFARWHRDQDGDDHVMIDIDCDGYCRYCLTPIYLIEATRSTRRKITSVLEDRGRRLGATVLVVYQDKSAAHPGEILVDDRTSGINHGWLPEARVWEMLVELRRRHDCSQAVAS